MLRAREPALRTAATPGPTGPARGRCSAGLLRRVAVLRRGAQARPVGGLGRDRCCAGGPDPRRGMVANVYRPEPPCRSSPLMSNLASVSSSESLWHRSSARVSLGLPLMAGVSGTRSSRWFRRRNTPRSAPRPASLGAGHSHRATWRSRVVPWRGGVRRWAPLGGGIMLLVFLGFSGERTDIGAHVAGFAMAASWASFSPLLRIA